MDSDRPADNPLADPGPEAAAAIEPLPMGYRRLLGRVCAAVADDERVRALWLAGSVGRGAADAGSDLDVVLTVADDAFETFAANWRPWLEAVAPVLLAHELPAMPGSFYSVTAGCERLDVVLERVGDAFAARPGTRIAVVDRDDLASRLAGPEADVRGPDVAALSATVEEFFRQQVIFPAAVVARQDWLLGVVGVTMAQQLIYRVFVESNQPLPAMGVKQWSSRLTAEQRRLLESLPVPQARRDDVLAAMLAVRRAMLTHGRAATERCGGTWPHALDAAVADYWARELALTSPETASGSSDPEIDDCSASTSLTTRDDRSGG